MWKDLIGNIYKVIFSPFITQILWIAFNIHTQFHVAVIIRIQI